MPTTISASVPMRKSNREIKKPVFFKFSNNLESSSEDGNYDDDDELEERPQRPNAAKGNDNAHGEVDSEDETFSPAKRRKQGTGIKQTVPKQSIPITGNAAVPAPNKSRKSKGNVSFEGLSPVESDLKSIFGTV